MKFVSNSLFGRIGEWFVNSHEKVCFTCSILKWLRETKSAETESPTVLQRTRFSHRCFYVTCQLKLYFWRVSYSPLISCEDRQANIFQNMHWLNQLLCVSKRTNMSQDSWNCMFLKPMSAIKRNTKQMTWNLVCINSPLYCIWCYNI